MRPVNVRRLTLIIVVVSIIMVTMSTTLRICIIVVPEYIVRVASCSHVSYGYILFLIVAFTLLTISLRSIVILIVGICLPSLTILRVVVMLLRPRHLA